LFVSLRSTHEKETIGNFGLYAVSDNLSTRDERNT
jgi:hypothetical protein